MGIAKETATEEAFLSQSRVLLLEGTNLSALGDKILLKEKVRATRLFKLGEVVLQEF